MTTTKQTARKSASKPRLCPKKRRLLEAWNDVAYQQAIIQTSTDQELKVLKAKQEKLASEVEHNANITLLLRDQVVERSSAVKDAFRNSRRARGVWEEAKRTHQTLVVELAEVQEHERQSEQLWAEKQQQLDQGKVKKNKLETQVRMAVSNQYELAMATTQNPPFSMDN